MSEYEVNNLRFNQDNDCFIVSLNDGIRIYNIEPLYELFHLESNVCGSIGFAEMFYRTNLIALVSAGKNNKYGENELAIWDDLLKSFIYEFTINLPILSAHGTRDKIILIVRNEIQVYALKNPPTKLCILDTRDNPKGVSALCPSEDNSLLAYPGLKCGSVQVIDLASSNTLNSSTASGIQAHESEIACLSFNHPGTLLATASRKGTLIRVFDVGKKRRLWELRRGSDSALFYSINFSQDSSFLCAASDKGTVHIFALKNSQMNKRSSFPKLGLLGPYIDSQWGIANFAVTPDKVCICTFSSNGNVVYAISADGTFQKYVFNTDGNCNREAYDNYLDLCQYPEI